MNTLKSLIALSLMTAVAGLCACGSGGETPDPEPKPTEPRIVKQVFATGSAPNDMVYADNSLYVANSLDNTVVRYSLTGGELASFTFDVGASPAYLAVDANYVFVACNGENTVRRFDRGTLAEVEGFSLDLGALDAAPPDDPNPDSPWSEKFAFIGPGQITATGDKVLLTFSHIISFAPTTYGKARYGWFYYADPLTIPETHMDAGSQLLLYQQVTDPLQAYNGQFTAYDSLNDRGLFVTSGAVLFDDKFKPYVDTDSFVAIHEFGGSHRVLNLGRVSAGQVALSPDGRTAYLGNGIDGNVYKLALPALLADAEVLRGAANPIVLTADFTFISDVAFSHDGSLLFCASFNTDEVYVVDTATDTVGPIGFEQPFDLSFDPALLAGCANLEIVPDAVEGYSYSVFVLHGVANSVSRIDIP